MLFIQLATLTAATAAVVTSGCGSSKTGSAASIAHATTPTTATVPLAIGKPLTRAQLIAQGDAICASTNAKIKAISAKTNAEIINALPQAAIYYNAEAESLSKLVPPASISRDWSQIVNDIELTSRYTSGTARYAKENQKKTAARLYKEGLKLRERWLAIAKRDGLKVCSEAR
jgi:hypothetical protein